MTISTSASGQNLPYLPLCKKINLAGGVLILALIFAGMLTSCQERPLPTGVLDPSEIYEQTGAPSPGGVPGQEYLGEKGRVTYLYLVLNESLNKGDIETAMNSIQELLYLAPTEELFREAVSIYEFSDRHRQALDTAITGSKLYPLDLTLHMMLAELMARSGNVDAAISSLKKFSAYYSENQKELSSKQKQKDLGELRLLLIRLFMADGRYREAEAAIAALPARERTATVLLYEVQILKSTGRNTEATEKLQELVQRHPNFTEGWIALASEAEKAKRYNEAAGYYKKALQTNDMPQIFLLMLNAMLNGEQYRSAAQQVANSPYPGEVKLQAAALFIDKQRLNEARTILLGLDDNPYLRDEVSVYLGMIAYDSNKNLPEAIERLNDVSPDSQARSQALHLKAMLHLKGKDAAGAQETAEALRDEFPELKDNWLFLAEVYNYASQYQDAETVVREGLEQWPDDTGLLFALGSSLGFQKKYDESVEVMEVILDSEPDNAIVLNYIGYTLAEADKELQRALELIVRALEIEPDSYHAVDSLAWVYYRLGEYDKAWNEIKRCIKMGGNEAVVWDHYGDIALALGRTRDASEGYQKALDLGVENQAEVEQKLKQARSGNRAER